MSLGQTTLVIKNDGTLWGAGTNQTGQLGVSTSLVPAAGTAFIQVLDGTIICAASGSSHSLAVKSDGTLWSTGYNNYGQLGTDKNMGLSTANFPWINVLSDVVFAVCGDNHSLAIKSDGSLWACGRNANGQLGVSSTVTTATYSWIRTLDDVVAVSASNSTTIAVKRDGSVWCCGDNSSGRFGGTAVAGPGTWVRTLVGVIDVACGTTFTHFLKDDNSLWSSGINSFGQLGTGDTNAVSTAVKTLDNVCKVSCGYGHAVALKKDGTVWVCGYDSNGQLGDGGTSARTTWFNILSGADDIMCGYQHTIVKFPDGTLKCAGANNMYQLGIGPINNTVSTPIIPTITSVKSLSEPHVIASYDTNPQIVNFTVDLTNESGIKGISVQDSTPISGQFPINKSAEFIQALSGSKLFRVPLNTHTVKLEVK